MAIRFKIVKRNTIPYLKIEDAHCKFEAIMYSGDMVDLYQKLQPYVKELERLHFQKR